MDWKMVFIRIRDRACPILCFLLISSLVYAQEISGDIKYLLSSEGKVIYGDEANSIEVIDYPENIQRVANYLNTLDIPPDQVLIEARVVEVKLQKEHSLGVNWSAFMDKGYMPIGRFKAGSAPLGASPAPIQQNISYKNTFYPPAQTSQGQESPFTFGIFDDNINIVLNTLASSLDTAVLSAPRVATVNNREAEIKVIQRLPWAEPQVSVEGTSGTITVTWKINFEDVGITLRVTPTINADGNITMLLSPEVSEKTDDYSLTVQQGATSVPYTVPVIDRRSAKTKVVVGSGKTIIIGGLIKDKTTKGESKIPLLGDIPYLGYLFKSKKDIKDKSELLIFVSPTIITSQEISRMAKEGKYGIAKEFTRERDRQEQMLVTMEKQEKVSGEESRAEVNMPKEGQRAFDEEREKLQGKILEEKNSGKP